MTWITRKPSWLSQTRPGHSVTHPPSADCFVAFVIASLHGALYNILINMFSPTRLSAPGGQGLPCLTALTEPGTWQVLSEYLQMEWISTATQWAVEWGNWACHFISLCLSFLTVSAHWVPCTDSFLEQMTSSAWILFSCLGKISCCCLQSMYQGLF